MIDENLDPFACLAECAKPAVVGRMKTPLDLNDVTGVRSLPIGRRYRTRTGDPTV